MDTFDHYSEKSRQATIDTIKRLLAEKKWYNHRDILMLNPHFHSIELRKEQKIIGAWDQFEECWKYPAFQFQGNDLHPLTQQFVNLVYSISPEYHTPEEDKNGWRKMFHIYGWSVQLSEQVMVLKELIEKIDLTSTGSLSNFMRSQEYRDAMNLDDKCCGLGDFFERYPEYTIKVLERQLYEQQHPEEFW